MQKREKLKVETTRSTNAMERLEIKSKCDKKVEAKGQKIFLSYIPIVKINIKVNELV